MTRTRRLKITFAYGNPKGHPPNDRSGDVADRFFCFACGRDHRAGSDIARDHKRYSIEGGHEIGRDLLGPPGILSTDEGDRGGVSHSRPRERHGPSAPLRSRLALAGGDREGIPPPGAQAPSRRRWRPP